MTGIDNYIHIEARGIVIEQLNKFINNTELIDDNSNLIEYGLSSIQIMQISGKLRKVGMKIPFAKMISNPTLKAWWNLIRENNGNDKNRIDKAEKKINKEPFELTDVQYAYWIGRQDGQPMGGVGCHAYLEFDGMNIDSYKLQSAWNTLQNHHAMLRMKFLEDGTQKEMDDPYSKKITVYDLREEKGLIKDKLEKIRGEISHRRLNVNHGQVAGIALTLMPGGKTRIHLDIDLLVADVQSLSIIIRDLAKVYFGQKITGCIDNWRFNNYLETRKKQMKVEKEEAFKYWQKRLDKMPGAPELPLKTKPEMINRPFFKRRRYFVDGEDWQSIKKNAANYKTTPSMVLLSVYALVLEHWSSNSNFLINIPLFNRQEDNEKIKNVVADFTNLLLLEVRLGEDKPFVEMLSGVQNQFYDSVAYSSYSGVQVQRDLAKLHSGERFVAPVVFACNLGTPLASDEDQAVLGELTYMISQTPQVWLDFQVYEKDGGVLLTWDAVDELFPKNLIDEMFKAYTSTFESLKDTIIWEKAIDMLPENQKEKRKKDIQLALPFPKPRKYLYTDFIENSKISPDNIAVLDSITGEKTSYSALLDKARYIAGMLKSNGIEIGDCVAITLPRGVEQIISILGVLLSGGCYVPVSIQQPDNRRNKIHKQVEIKYVLTNYRLKEINLWDDRSKVLAVEDSKKYQPLLETIAISPEDSAYVIMTSGSTGEPKGVEISHYSAVNTIEDINRRYEVCSEDSVLAVSSIDFDLSVYDIFGLLGAGGTIVIISDETKRDASHWLKVVKKYNITIWNSVPILLDMLITMTEGEKKELPLRIVMLSGDWIGMDLPERLSNISPKSKLVAMGGATEASIWSNYFDVILPVSKEWKSIPYGRPLTNQIYRVVNKKGKDCPNLVPGELWIGGAGVAKGYKGDTNLTNNKFVVEKEIRWYKTGDVGMFWEDGTIEFLGRIDHQVKIKGHRIELGEIENAVKCNSIVAEARAIVDENRNIVIFIIVNNKCKEKIGINKIASNLNNDFKQGNIDLKCLNDVVEISLLKIFSNNDLFVSVGEKQNIEDIMNKFKAKSEYHELVKSWINYLVECKLLNKKDNLYENDISFNEKIITLKYNLKIYNERIQLLIKDIVFYADKIIRGEIEGKALYEKGDCLFLPKNLDEMLDYSNQCEKCSLNIINSLEKYNFNMLEIGTRSKSFASVYEGKNKCRYFYTDISKIFMEMEKKIVGDKGIAYCKFSEIKENQMDLVIANNSLHLFMNREEILKMILSKLSPRGILVFNEYTNPTNPIYMITSGLLQNQIRDINHGLLDMDDWKSVLNKAGFKLVYVSEASGPLEKRTIVAVSSDIIKVIAQSLRSKLPEYMLPSKYFIVDEMPLNSQGKLDYKSLVKEANRYVEDKFNNVNRSYTETEVKVIDILKEVLNNNNINIKDSFFKVGGDSLRAIRCLKMLENKFDIKVPLNIFLQSVNIEEMAKRVDDEINKYNERVSGSI